MPAAQNVQRRTRNSAGNRWTAMVSISMIFVAPAEASVRQSFLARRSPRGRQRFHREPVPLRLWRRGRDLFGGLSPTDPLLGRNCPTARRTLDREANIRGAFGFESGL